MLTSLWPTDLFICRLQDSKNHVDQMEKMLCLLEELQELKRSRDKKLQEMEDEAMALNRKIETLEQTIKEMYHTLHEKQCENSDTSTKLKNSRTQQFLPAKATVDLNEKLQERPYLVSAGVQFSALMAVSCQKLRLWWFFHLFQTSQKSRWRARSTVEQMSKKGIRFLAVRSYFKKSPKFLELGLSDLLHKS